MRLYLILMLSGLTFALQAQAPRHFRHFTEKDGLSDNRVQTIFRDRQGFLWVGTANGLNRYDGYAFKHYLPDAAHPDRSVCSETIQDIKQDQSGNIWIATNNGLNQYDPTTGRFRTWNNVGRDDGSLPNPIVWNLLLDRQDRLWLSTDNRDLCRYDAPSNKFIQYPWRKFVSTVLPDTPADAYLVIYFLKPKSDHALWMATNMGVFSFDWQDEKFEYYPVSAELTTATGPSDCKEAMHFGTWDKDILRYDPCDHQWAQIKLPFPKDLVGGRRLVNEVYPYHDGFCVLTRQGLFWLPRNSAIILHLTETAENDAEAPSGMITDAFQDSDGALWLGGDFGYCPEIALHN